MLVPDFRKGGDIVYIIYMPSQILWGGRGGDARKRLHTMMRGNRSRRSSEDGAKKEAKSKVPCLLRCAEEVHIWGNRLNRIKSI